MIRVAFLFSTFVTIFGMLAASLSSGVLRSGSIDGLLLDPDGKSLAGVSVTIEDGTARTYMRTVSDDSGKFVFRAVQPAEYKVTARRDGFVESSLEVLISPDEKKRIEIILVPHSHLRIHERVMVVGDPTLLETIPGSAHYLGERQLSKVQLDFDDIHQIVRQIPGVIIQEEDGFGRRPNIGFRGTGSERSAKITLMEDGVLIAPAPYAAPAAYYFPTTGRMEALEVRKGSSQIKHGPMTQGGALNLISSSIPGQLRLNGTVSGGQFGSGKLHLNAGNSYKNFGWLVETYQLASGGFKELDGGGDTGFDHHDYLTKFRFNTSEGARFYQALEVKLGYTDQTDHETYVGLTEDDFRATSKRRYRGSARDVFKGTHKQYQGRYFLAPNDRLDFTATVYRNDFHRNWYKLQSIAGIGLNQIFDDNEAHARELGILKGDDSQPDELYIRANNRTYYSQGVQGTVGLQMKMGSIPNRFELGLRYHRDEEDRFQHEDGYRMKDGAPQLTSRGAPGSQSNRVSSASAWAFFFQDTVELGRFLLTPGFRYENIDFMRTDYSRSDPDRREPARISRNPVSVFIPGVGANYQSSIGITFFGGVHKGFSPPGPGANSETLPESAINYEAGVRLFGGPVRLDITGFYADYENLLGADTLSSGGMGEGDLYNGGKARATGLEVSASYDLSRNLGTGFGLPMQLTYTLNDAEFKSSFESDFEPWGTVESGDDIPYIPRQQLFASFGMERRRWRVQLEAAYMGQMRDKAGQGPILPGEGTDSYLVTNVSGEYTLRELQNDNQRISLYVSLRNVFDEESIVTRRPAGARPGIPRTLMAGLRFRLGR